MHFISRRKEDSQEEDIYEIDLYILYSYTLKYRFL